jgi:lysophospholipase L1-like esterase
MDIPSGPAYHNARRPPGGARRFFTGAGGFVQPAGRFCIMKGTTMFGWRGQRVWVLVAFVLGGLFLAGRTKHFEPLKSANFGIGGDRTQHVLWRLQNGELEGIQPKVAVLMIGTNNLGSNTEEEIAAGITAIVKAIHSKSPDTKVLLLGIFPRSAKATDAVRDKIKKINERIAEMGKEKYVRYLDIGQKFLEEDGSLSKKIMPDYLHLSAKGYQIWADAVEPKVKELLEK